MSQKIRVGAIGGGVYGTAIIKCIDAYKRQGRAELISICQLNTTALKQQEERFQARGYTDYREMFAREQLDAVTVATPDDLHSEMVIAAAEAKVHVLVTKPLDTVSARAQQMIDACKANGVMLYVDFHKRFDPAHIRLKQEIAQNRLGKIQYGYACMEDKIVVPRDWLKDWAARSSPNWFLGVHFYDLVYWLTGAQPVSVYATGHKGKLTALGLDTFDSICATVKYADGSSFTFDTSWILPESFPSIVNQQIRIIGQDGIAEVDSQDRGYASASTANPESQVINPFNSAEFDHPVWGMQVDGYNNQSILRFLDLVAAMKFGGASLASLDGQYADGTQALVATRIAEAVDTSIRSGEVVRL